MYGRSESVSGESDVSSTIKLFESKNSADSSHRHRMLINW